MSSSRLASLLVQDGVVPARRMADAFQRQVIYGGALDTLLLEMGLVGEDALLDAIGRTLGLPTTIDAVDVGGLSHPPLASWFPQNLAEQFRIAPIARADAGVKVLVVESLERAKLDELSFQLGMPLDPVATTEARFVDALHTLYGAPIPSRYASLLARLQRPKARSKPQPEPTPASTSPGPRIITDVTFAPTPAPIATPIPIPIPEPTIDAPSSEQTEVESQTPRLTTRQESAPAVTVAHEHNVAIPTARPMPEPTPEPTPSATVDEIDAARVRIENADERDVIFSALCEGARTRVPFAAVFVVQGRAVAGKMALGESWLDPQALAAVRISLETDSPVRTVVSTSAPFVGKIGDEPALQTAMEALGRAVPCRAAIVPMRLKERVVAMLIVDGGKKKLDAGLVTELAPLIGAAERSFSRIIMRAKGGEPTPPSATTTTATTTAAPAATPTPAAAASSSTAAAARGLSAALVSTSVDAPPTDTQPTESVDELIRALFRDDAIAAAASDKLLAMREAGARAVVARLPGSLTVSRSTSRRPHPHVSQHGPLLAMTLRFGRMAIPPLLHRVEDASLDTRYYVTMLLGELRHASVVDALGERLFDPDVEVRRVATEALANMPTCPELQSRIELLRAELPGPDPFRQRFATEALGALKDTSSVPRLIELVKHHDPAVVMAAHRALIVVTKQDFGTSRWRWRGWWEKHRTEDRTEWLIEGLSHSELEMRQESANELVALTGEDFGYDAALPKRDRDNARRRWLEWWQGHGSKG